MIRALIEFLFTIAAILVARAILNSVLKGIARASTNSFGSGSPPDQHSRQSTARTNSDGDSAAGQLHKDPVCGTYVAENSSLARRVGGQTFYYCSDKCREKHALVAR
jgi:YHS domain-containing protein